MHDIKSIRDNPQAFDAALRRRGLTPLSASLLAIDEKRRAAIQASEQAQCVVEAFNFYCRLAGNLFALTEC